MNHDRGANQNDQTEERNALSRIDDRTLRRYLLGQLGLEDSAHLEDLFFSNDEVFRRLEYAEEELMEEYVGDTLGDTDRASFESHFLSTEQRKNRLEAIGDLHRHAQLQDEKPLSTWEVCREFFRFSPPALKLSLAAAALIAIILPAGLGLQLVRNNREYSELQARTHIASLLLQPQLRSGGAAPTLRIAEGANLARLELELEGSDYSRFRAAILDVEGTEVLRFGNVTPTLTDNRVKISIDLPVFSLQAGDYLVELEGAAEGGDFEPVKTYGFRVIFESQ